MMILDPDVHARKRKNEVILMFGGIETNIELFDNYDCIVPILLIYR